MRRLQSPLVLIAVLLGLVTLQLGGNRPIAWVFAALGLAVIAANAALGVKPGAQATPLRLVLRNCHFALAGFALLGGIALVQLLSTTAFGASLATSPLVPLTFDPPATLGSLLTVLTLGLLFLLSALTCRTGDDARMLVALHFWATALIGVLSLFAFLLGGDLIFGFDAWAYQGSLTGPFVNRNSFATFLGMGLASGVALALGSVARLRRTYGRDRSDGYVVSAYLTSATTFSFLAALALLGIALLLTQSRAGLGATVFGVGMVLSLYLIRRRRRGRASGGALLAVVLASLPVALALFTLSGDGVVDRLDSLQTDWSVRGAIYADTIAGILQRPFFGFGGGSFAAAFPSFRSEALASPGAVDLAHNTYLALAFEFGVPVTMAWLALLAVTGWRTARAVLSRRGHAFELPLAAVGAATVVGVHSAIDFSAEMHAIALWLAALCGGACGVIVWSGSRRSRQGAG